MQLLIRTPESTVLEVDNVTSVTAESPDGRFGVLPRHMAMTAALKESLLTYVTEGTAKTAVVMGGLLQTDGQTVTVLTAAAEDADSLDKARVLAAKERAEKRLQLRDESVDVQRAELALSRSLVRMKALK
ncbi:MAG: ATP synthase F1 subunit epsilon [Vampirovibrionales bacterium]|nr:ATP synthase F1 subunit epsilon [Vampirovibrionales bacterium]